MSLHDDGGPVEELRNLVGESLPAPLSFAALAGGRRTESPEQPSNDALLR